MYNIAYKYKKGSRSHHARLPRRGPSSGGQRFRDSSLTLIGSSHIGCDVQDQLSTSSPDVVEIKVTARRERFAVESGALDVGASTCGDCLGKGSGVKAGDCDGRGDVQVGVVDRIFGGKWRGEQVLSGGWDYGTKLAGDQG